MKAIFILLLTINSSSFAQETDLSNLDEVKKRIQKRWESHPNIETTYQFRLLFTEEFKGTIYGRNIPNNALEFELILEDNTAHILWYSSSGRCVSSQITKLEVELELKFKDELIGFNRKIWRTTGCPSF